MKKQFVEALQEGDVVNDYFVAIRKDLREQHNGGKFLGMVFKDRTGEIGGILWNGAAGVARLFEVGDVVNVRGTCASHQERLQIRVEQVLPLREHEYDAQDLVNTPEGLDEVRGRYLELLNSLTNPWLKALVDSFLADEALMARLEACCAGKRWHHACRGGLLQHCYEMSRFALTACELYPALDRDLLLAAIFLHDIGKMDEMTQGLMVDYTNAGKLIGHLCMGADMVQRRIDRIDGFPESLRLQLLHCILSHHGELDRGSPVVPKTLEAMVLFHCDNLSAQTDAFLRLIDETRERGLAWSDYIPNIDRQVWTKDH